MLERDVKVVKGDDKSLESLTCFAYLLDPTSLIFTNRQIL